MSAARLRSAAKVLRERSVWDRLPVHDCDRCHMRPGSDTARAEGCVCPVLDNGRGHQIPEGTVVHLGCPVHNAFGNPS